MSTTTELRAPDVVCIAASTGGPQAVGELLEALTVRPPCPVLVVQHMPRSFTGRFAERLHLRSDLDVHEAETGALLRPGQVLVAPGDAHLRIRHGRVRLSHDPPIGGLRPRADLTMSDLAAAYGDGAMAVVLSGMGTDGFDGAVAVVEAGGQVLAQDAESCTVDGMPARIREEGLADLVARPSQLGAALDLAWRAGERPPTARRRTATVTRTVTVRRTSTGGGHRVGNGDPDRSAIDRIFVLLRRLESIDLRAFKSAQVDRNLRSFADQHGFGLEELGAALERHSELRGSLLDRITINVTSFFRDRERWDELARLVVPRLGPAPRVWNPGCADGSETCTLAMVLVESGREPTIWATDVNRARIDAARAGRYGDRAVADLAAAMGSPRRDRWFTADGDTWLVDPDLRGRIRYERHDAVDGALEGQFPPPFDLVVCRNLIIYLTPEGRDRLLDRISDALSDDGAVLLGNAERILRPERYGLERIAPGLYRRGGGEAAS